MPEDLRWRGLVPSITGSRGGEPAAAAAFVSHSIGDDLVADEEE